MIYGLDVFKFVSSQGMDIELVLDFVSNSGCIVDWLTFIQVATEEGWLMRSIITRIEQPIIDIWGKQYWLEVKQRIVIWFIAYMKNIRDQENRI